MLTSRIRDVGNFWRSHRFRKAEVALAPLLCFGGGGVISPATAAAAGYANPLRGNWYRTGRTDMGVDFCLAPGAPIGAVGDGVVVGIIPNWFKHQPYVWYRLSNGLYAGRYVYVAEQITSIAPVGAHLSAGRPVAYFKRSGTCIEMGWSSATGWTLAQVTTGYHEGQVTTAGVSFAYFLLSLGVHGPFQLTPTYTKRKPTG